MDEVSFVWFVGLFEGEGCFVFTRGKATRIQITSTDLDVLEKVQSVVGGYISPQYNRADKPNWKPCWVWNATSELSDVLVPLMIPMLCSRRKQRAEEWIASRKEAVDRRLKFSDKKNEMLKLHKQGMTQREIAKQFGVSQPYVAKVVKNGSVV